MSNKTGKRVSLLLIAIAFLLSGCGTTNRQTNVDALTKIAGLTSENLQTKTFVLRALSKTTAPVNILRVYIEGDGFAWVNRTTPSDDPTPRNPLGLKLAAADPSPNVLYLARPCQYVGLQSAGICTTRKMLTGAVVLLKVRSTNVLVCKFSLVRPVVFVSASTFACRLVVPHPFNKKAIAINKRLTLFPVLLLIKPSLCRVLSCGKRHI